jgi:DNA-binding SARP family transcriptional activator
VPIEAAAGDISETTAVTSAPTALLVRILGAPRVTDRAELGTRGVSLVAYLACRRRPATTSHIQEALWGGRPVQAKTIWNVVSRTRVALGSLPDGTAAFPAGDATNRTFTLAPGVRTDADLLREAYDRQRSQPDDPVAVRALAAALELVEGPPFDGPGFEWAYREGQHAAAAGHLIEQAALAVANDATRRGDLAAARHALARGLVGLPGNEVLYRARLSLEAEVGNRVGVEAVFRELVGFLEDLDAEPSPETVAHYAALLRPSVSHDTR